MDIDKRREGYRRRCKAVMVDREVAARIDCTFDEIYGLPKKISALMDYFDGLMKLARNFALSNIACLFVCYRNL